MNNVSGSPLLCPSSFLRSKKKKEQLGLDESHVAVGEHEKENGKRGRRAQPLSTRLPFSETPSISNLLVPADRLRMDDG